MSLQSEWKEKKNWTLNWTLGVHLHKIASIPFECPIPMFASRFLSFFRVNDSKLKTLTSNIRVLPSVSSCDTNLTRKNPIDRNSILRAGAYYFSVASAIAIPLSFESVGIQLKFIQIRFFINFLNTLTCVAADRLFGISSWIIYDLT